MSVVKGPVPSPMCMLFAVCLAVCLTTAIVSWHCSKWFHAKPLESPWSWMAVAEWFHAKPVESKPYYAKPWMVASVTALTIFVLQHLLKELRKYLGKIQGIKALLLSPMTYQNLQQVVMSPGKRTAADRGRAALHD